MAFHILNLAEIAEYGGVLESHWFHRRCQNNLLDRIACRVGKALFAILLLQILNILHAKETIGLIWSNVHQDPAISWPIALPECHRYCLKVFEKEYAVSLTKLLKNARHE